MYPYFEQITASRPEQEFTLRWTTRWNMEWWYKNGDEGKAAFRRALYGIGKRRKRCFSVDFIVRLKSGTICLFDTKTRAAMRMRQKRTMPLDYIPVISTGKRRVGILIKDEGMSNWYYPGGVIENTDNIDGWSYCIIWKPYNIIIINI